MPFRVWLTQVNEAARIMSTFEKIGEDRRCDPRDIRLATFAGVVFQDFGRWCKPLFAYNLRENSANRPKTEGVTLLPLSILLPIAHANLPTSKSFRFMSECWPR
jgi:hypothetical protein